MDIRITGGNIVLLMALSSGVNADGNNSVDPETGIYGAGIVTEGQITLRDSAGQGRKPRAFGKKRIEPYQLNDNGRSTHPQAVRRANKKP